MAGGRLKPAGKEINAQNDHGMEDGVRETVYHYLTKYPRFRKDRFRIFDTNGGSWSVKFSDLLNIETQQTGIRAHGGSDRSRFCDRCNNKKVIYYRSKRSG